MEKLPVFEGIKTADEMLSEELALKQKKPVVTTPPVALSKPE